MIKKTRKITEYTVVHGKTVKDLVKRVNEHIKDGWEPIDRIISHHQLLLQAMVKVRLKQ